MFLALPPTAFSDLPPLAKPAPSRSSVARALPASALAARHHASLGRRLALSLAALCRSCRHRLTILRVAVAARHATHRDLPDPARAPLKRRVVRATCRLSRH